ncbi:MAG TPA: RNA polymerase sigma-70 factor [Gemmatimonadaceae bacterium]|nr:RNA polymerase sigma-70 factor [Gemmatimonadaceae bacterium]
MRHVSVAPAAVAACESAGDLAREQALVARVRAGDRAAFDTLVVTYYDDLRAYVTAFVRSEAEAEELVQEVFLKVWNIRSDWDVHSSLRRYLIAAARHLALDHCRRQRMMHRWATRLRGSEERPAMGTLPSAHQHVAEAELRTVLRRVIDRLPAKCRQVAILRFERQMSRAEIADALGVSLKTVERHIARALRGIRAPLARYLAP